MQTPGVRESSIVGLIAAIQFVNVLDFMMVMPLGPDFASALGIPNSQIGLVGGAYTFAAGVAGLAGSFFLDRFDRRKALFVAMLGLGLATLSGALATGLPTLLLARLAAGAFGGPATALSLSIIADVVPPSRRGRAMGVVIGAFSAASVLGVPAGLELARLGGWRMPFLAVAALCFVVTVGAVAYLPPMRGHLGASAGGHAPRLIREEVLLAYLTVAVAMLASFLLIPNFSAYFQRNLGFPREDLGTLYLAGGVASLLAMNLSGRMVDRYGATPVSLVGAAVLVGITLGGYVISPPLVPIVAVFTIFSVAMGVRAVAMSSLNTRVPGPRERARFMSFQSAVQHFFAAIGSVAGTRLLTEGPGGALVGMPRVGTLSAVISLVLPVVIWRLEHLVRRREGSPEVLPVVPA